MKSSVWFVLITIGVILFAGCSGGRLSEEEYVQKANDSMARGDIDDAISFLESAVKYYPESEKFQENRAKLFDLVNRAAEKYAGTPIGDRYMAKAIALAGEEGDSLRDWLVFRNTLAEAEKNPDKANEVFKQITLEGYYRIAQVYLSKNDFKGSIIAYEKLLEVYPNDPGNYKPLFMIGFNYSEYLNDYEKSRPYFQKVVDEYPNCDLVVSAKFMLENMGKNPEEIIFLETASDDSK
jgi:tetratricopeptide (TPR) repeat protein